MEVAFEAMLDEEEEGPAEEELVMTAALERAVLAADWIVSRR